MDQAYTMDIWLNFVANLENISKWESTLVYGTFKQLT